MTDVELVNADGVTVFRGTQSGGGSQTVLTTPVSLTAAEILALPIRKTLVAGAAGVMAIPWALVVQTVIGTGGYDMTDVLPSLSSGSGSIGLNALPLALGQGGATAIISQDVLASAISAPAGDVLEGGIALSSELSPSASGGTPNWGFTGTLYYIEFTP